MADLDVTQQMEFYLNDDETLPITKCVCGKTFEAWRFLINIYREDAEECPSCGRRLYFTNTIHVYQVVD